jgi:hypothetical protein
MLTREQCRDFFEDHDGMMLDLYVPATDADDWGRLVTFLRTGPYRLTFLLAGEFSPLADDVSTILGQGELGAVLHVHLRDISVATFFYGDDEIEFVIFSRDVSDEPTFARLVGFMRDVARVVGKPMFLGGPNSRDRPLLRVGPGEGDEGFAWERP